MFYERNIFSHKLHYSHKAEYNAALKKDTALYLCLNVRLKCIIVEMKCGKL